jgi:hypothetical protein
MIELAIKGNAGPLIKAIREERFSFDKRSLSAFLDGYSEIVLDTLQYYPDMTCRLSGTNYLPEDRHWFCERLREQTQFYVDDWLNDPRKWHTINVGTVPLRV